MTRRLLALLPLLVLQLGCGGGDAPAQAQLALALTSDIAGKAKMLQVAFVKQSAALDCTRVRSTCLREAGLTLQPLAGAQAGRPVFSVPFDPAAAGTDGQPLELEIAAGNYILAVEALDAEGKLLANGCQLRLELKAGDSKNAAVGLGSYGGPVCDARFP